MWNNSFGLGQLGSGMDVGTKILLVVVLIWSAIWKGLALWKSARVGSKPWFIAILLINTAGVLEILYLYVFSRPRIKATDVTATKV